MVSFEEFFTCATGRPPYGYQARLASGGLPAVIHAATGSGKTGAILAWAWRSQHGTDPAATPRRLVYALPQRTLVEQVAGEAKQWLGNLRAAGLLPSDIAVHVVMGGAGDTQRQWRLDMHQPSIVVGTVDSLVSKALNRGYGISRATYPIDFALVTNGAHWIIDEIQLCPESTTTLRQLAAFAASFGTAEPFGLTCMSATVPAELLSTVDNPGPVTDVVRIENAERVGELARRLDARRTVRRLPADPGDHKAIAQWVRQRHRPGTLTLVVVNMVETARQIHIALAKAGGVECALVHSRFRGVEREKLIEEVKRSPGATGRIITSTQVIEAGIDIDATTLITEAAPWPSIVQRAGRCNRRGLRDDAELWWLPPAKPLPYAEADITATEAELAALEDESVTGEDLLARQVFTTPVEVSVLRRTDLMGLFDTTPDLDGADLDVAPYVRDAEDLDAQLAWATWEPAEASGRPTDTARPPRAQWRCRVPLGEVAKLVKRGVPVWRFDQVTGRWAKVMAASPARPGEVLVVAAADGGYTVESGFDPTINKPVPGCPLMETSTDPATGVEEAYGDDAASLAQSKWLSLAQHSDDARDQAHGLLATLRTDLPAELTAAITTAAYAHDAGKAHKTWQDAICRLASAERKEEIDRGRPWAKSDSNGRLRYGNGVRQFRHELASVLFLDGPLRGLLDGVAEPDLVRYLVLAHHGKLRVQVREPGEPVEGALLGLRDGDPVRVPAVLGQPAGDVTIDLSQFALGGTRSWTRVALGLRDRFGPFVLAYLETLVRIADWRASARMKVAE